MRNHVETDIRTILLALVPSVVAAYLLHSINQDMHPLYSLVISQSVGLCNSVVAQKDNAKHCDCFRTEGVSPAYFTNHRFFDYRNIPSQFVSHPAVTTDIDNDQDGPSSSDFFTSTSWKQDWEVQTWNNADALKDSTSDANVLMGYSRNNVYIGKYQATKPDA